MKKKAIEKIPYLKLPCVSRKKKVKYVGITAVMPVDQEEHFFLEVYRNDKAARDVPVARVVVNKKDFGTYFPESGVWSRGKIETETWNDVLIWEKPQEINRRYRDRAKEENILHSAEDLNRIKTFFKDEVENWRRTDWWDYIDKTQDHIVCKERNKRRTRQYEKRQKALQERIENTPELPEQEILTWADNRLFGRRHYIFYKKKGRKAVICCSACGGVKEGSWKTGESYESQFKTHLKEPRKGHWGQCPLCGEYGLYHPQGTAKAIHAWKKQVFTADRYKETGAVIRYVLLEKEWVLEELVDDRGELVMIRACEKLTGCEIARTYFTEGGKVQTDYQKHNPYSGKDFWDDCNMYGMSNISVNAAHLFPGFAQALKGTMLQYSAIELYAAETGEVNARDYLIRYRETPQIEMLVKLKLYGVVESLVKCEYGIVADSDARRPDQFLGIRQDKLKLLIAEKGRTGLLNVLQMEKQLGQNWTEGQISALEEIRANLHQIERALSITTLQKVLNNIEKYAGCEFGTGCSRSAERIRHTATIYFDYLSMRIQRGYDMTNTVYQKPRNLQAAHNKMLVEINKDAQDARMKEVETVYPLIRKNYRKLRNKYLYEDDRYIIRPARSAKEIVLEGRILHHCVGGDTYLGQHNRQESIILMLRFKEEPEIPYITVEIRKDRIMQWYGANNKKPDQENMQKWLDAYVAQLKGKHPLKELRELELMEAI